MCASARVLVAVFALFFGVGFRVIRVFFDYDDLRSIPRSTVSLGIRWGPQLIKHSSLLLDPPLHELTSELVLF